MLFLATIGKSFLESVPVLIHAEIRRSDAMKVTVSVLGLNSISKLNDKGSSGNRDSVSSRFLIRLTSRGNQLEPNKLLTK